MFVDCARQKIANNPVKKLFASRVALFHSNNALLLYDFPISTLGFGNFLDSTSKNYVVKVWILELCKLLVEYNRTILYESYIYSFFFYSLFNYGNVYQ